MCVRCSSAVLLMVTSADLLANGTTLWCGVGISASRVYGPARNGVRAEPEDRGDRIANEQRRRKKPGALKQRHQSRAVQFANRGIPFGE